MNGAKVPPDDYEGLRSLILEQRPTLPKRIAQVAAYSLDHPEEIAFGTAASIAGTSGVQPSTLIRFAQHFGYDGFSSLQSVFRKRMRDRFVSYDDRLNALETAKDGNQSGRIVESFALASIQSIEKLMSNISYPKFDEAIARLTPAKTIYIVARRRSYPIASYLAYAFGKLNICYQLADSAAGLVHETLRFANAQDAAVIVSFSPYAPATLEHARTLSSVGTPIIAITDSAFSPLAEIADQWFEIAESDYAGFRSLAATMAFAMSIAIALAEARRKLDGAQSQFLDNGT